MIRGACPIPNERLVKERPARGDSVIVDATLHADSSTMKFLYGGTVPVQTAADGSRTSQCESLGLSSVMQLRSGKSLDG
jgi:hypothetical protein